MSSGRLRRTLVVSVLPLLAMCTAAPESRRAADRFMQLYYGESNVADAVKLCTSAAKAKLEAELAAMQGMAPPAASDKPQVRFRLASESVTRATEATYAYQVDARTSDVHSLTTTLVLSGAGGQWLVTSFAETGND
jgi:hypothetical protein